ncbi:hypothetical protein NQD34_010821 [Periophthalmus magnuspinnatus]|nr:hypothetical protein NQD34_010821 [Periophthalmus magnuspinnatus]
MASIGIQLLASVLCLFGWAGIIFACALPMWRVTAFVGSTIVTSQTVWEGIWMTCVVQSTGQLQCKPYDSMLALTADLQASRALMVLAITTGSAGLILAFIGGKCTKFLDNEGPETKGKVAVAAGAVFIGTGLLCLIPTTWVAGALVKKFYGAAIDAQKRELGACLYIGWGSAILLMLGGSLFITSACPLKSHNSDKNPSVRYLVVRSSNGSSQAGSHHRLPSVQNHPVGAMARVQSYKEPTSWSNHMYTRPQAEDGEPIPEESERSWVPSTKSQMKHPGSVKSNLSEESTRKSQLEQAKLKEVAELARSDNEDASTNPAKTYL